MATRIESLSREFEAFLARRDKEIEDFSFQRGYQRGRLEERHGAHCKHTEDKTDNPTLDKCAVDEPIFVLRGRDASAVRTIMHWLAINIDSISEDKARAAFEHAMLMKRYTNTKVPD